MLPSEGPSTTLKIIMNNIYNFKCPVTNCKFSSRFNKANSNNTNPKSILSNKDKKQIQQHLAHKHSQQEIMRIDQKFWSDLDLHHCRRCSNNERPKIYLSQTYLKKHSNTKHGNAHGIPQRNRTIYELFKEHFPEAIETTFQTSLQYLTTWKFRPTSYRPTL